MKKILKLSLILVMILPSFVIFTNNVPAMAGTLTDGNKFSDSFSTSTISTSWTPYNDPNVILGEGGGTLNGGVTSAYSSSSWQSAYIQKKLSTLANQVDVDYSFNFASAYRNLEYNSMGRIYVIGKDGSTTRWLTGLTDGWSAYSAKPLIYGYDNNGNYNPAISWKGSSQMIAISGSGHITVSLLSSSEVAVTLTFPALSGSGQTSQTWDMQVGGPTTTIQLLFSIAPSQYTYTGESWHFDNYIESTVHASDNFNTAGGPDTNYWTTYLDPGITSLNTGGTLNPTVNVNSLNSNFQSAYVLKPLTGSANSIDVDYSINFQSTWAMGRIYVIGKDASNTKTRWLVGLTDGWSGDTAKPIIYGYDSSGNYNSGISWGASSHVVGVSASGHIRVEFLSATEVNVSITFSRLGDGSTSKWLLMNVGGPTSLIQLYFEAPPQIYYYPGQNWNFDNYVENLQKPQSVTITHLDDNAYNTPGVLLTWVVPNDEDTLDGYIYYSYYNLYNHYAAPIPLTSFDIANGFKTIDIGLNGYGQTVTYQVFIRNKLPDGSYGPYTSSGTVSVIDNNVNVATSQSNTPVFYPGTTDVYWLSPYNFASGTYQFAASNTFTSGATAPENGLQLSTYSNGHIYTTLSVSVGWVPADTNTQSGSEYSIHISSSLLVPLDSNVVYNGQKYQTYVPFQCASSCTGFKTSVEQVAGPGSASLRVEHDTKGTADIDPSAIGTDQNGVSINHYLSDSSGNNNMPTVLDPGNSLSMLTTAASSALLIATFASQPEVDAALAIGAGIEVLNWYALGQSSSITNTAGVTSTGPGVYTEYQSSECQQVYNAFPYHPEGEYCDGTAKGTAAQNGWYSDGLFTSLVTREKVTLQLSASNPANWVTLKITSYVDEIVQGATGIQAQQVPSTVYLTFYSGTN